MDCARITRFHCVSVSFGAKSRFRKLLKTLETKIGNGVIRDDSGALQARCSWVQIPSAQNGLPEKLANSWQNGFVGEIPGKGKRENGSVFTGDLNGGPGWT